MPATRISPELIERSFGLAAIVENRRVVLPLKAVECEFAVAAEVVEVRMTQVFRQENPKPLDCDYLFPLPADAAVYFCEADINGRFIRAVVKERGEAVRLAEEKKAEGRRVALVEAERENLFTLTLKNLQPDDLVLVTLKYIQLLRYLADMPSVEIPFCPGVRYIPGNPLIRSNRGKGIADDTDQAPDASRISPVRMDREHPDASFIEIRGRLDGEFVDASSLLSPSHNIISRPQGDHVVIQLSDRDEVPDRDFVLRWKETKAEQLMARAWIQDLGTERYALMEIRAPKAADAPVPMDFYFLVDHSGSMEGVKWQKAALAVQTSAARLAEDDRIMLTLFNSSPRDFAERPLPPAHMLADANFKQLGQLAAVGGTELAIALRHVLGLAECHSRGRQKALILITDAQVGNEAWILKIMEKAGDLAVHCFGIDIALNDALLLALARQHGGTFHSLNPADDVAGIVSDLAQTIRHPVLHDLSLSAGWETAVKFLPPLYSGQVLQLSVRSGGDQPLELAARNGSREVVPIPITRLSANSEAPWLHWCKNRIQNLMTEGSDSAAIALSVKSNMICPLTAFIAWDEAEKVAVASHALAQPAMMLEEMNMRFCGPAPSIRGIAHDVMLGSLGTDSGIAGARMLIGELQDACTELRPAQMRGEAQDSAGLFFTASPKPEEVVRAIAGHALADGNSGSPPPYPRRGDREAALNSLFSRIYARGRTPGLHTIWQQIKRWAFDSEAHMLERSTLLAKLLLELLPKADRCWSAHRQLFNQLMELDKKSGNSSGDPTRVIKLIGGPARTEAELVQLIEAEFHHRVDSKLVADYVQIPGQIRAAVEAFAGQHIKTR